MQVSNTLREGDTIFVKIIEQTSPHTYVAGFSGGRFSVSSQIPLKIGDGFLAKIAVVDGKIQLAQVKLAQNISESKISETENVASIQTKNLSHGFSGEITPDLAAYFNSLGLAADGVTMRLFQQMKTLGMKFDLATLKKAWKSAHDAACSDDEAADVALILERKGLKSSASAIDAVLGNMPFGSSGSGGKNNNSKDNNKNNSDGRGDYDNERGKNDVSGIGSYGDESGVYDSVISASEIKKFFMQLFNGDFSGGKNVGMISLFNSMSLEESDWVSLPFEFELFESESIDDEKTVPVSKADFLKASFTGKQNERGNGNFRFFWGKNAKKLALNIFWGGKNYYFVLYYIGDKCTKIKFGMDSESNLEKIKNAALRLQELSGVATEHADIFETSGFCPDDEPVTVVRGLA